MFLNVTLPLPMSGKAIEKITEVGDGVGQLQVWNAILAEGTYAIVGHIVLLYHNQLSSQLGKLDVNVASLHLSHVRSRR